LYTGVHLIFRVEVIAVRLQAMVAPRHGDLAARQPERHLHFPDASALSR